MYGLRITYHRPGTLEIAQSRTQAALRLVVYLCLLAVFDLSGYALASAAWPTRRDLAASPGGALVCLVWVLACLTITLLSLSDIFHLFRIVVVGEVFTLNRDTRTIEHNGKIVARFSDVAGVEMRKYHPEEMTTEPGELWNSRRKRFVSIVLRNGQRLSVFRPSRMANWPSRVQEAEMTDLTSLLADILDVEPTFAYEDLL